MTNLTIISAQYLYSHSQNFLVTFCVPVGTCARPTPNKTHRQKWGCRKQMCQLTLNINTVELNLNINTCCLSLEGHYSRNIFRLLSWLTNLKICRKLNFRINDHLQFVIIVWQKHLSQALCYVKSLLLWIQRYVNWRTWWTLYPPLHCNYKLHTR